MIYSDKVTKFISKEIFKNYVGYFILFWMFGKEACDYWNKIMEMNEVCSIF